MAPPTSQLRPAERLVFFTDAVVAIAMTLLILPLLESVTEAARNGLDTAAYLHEHDGQLFAFALSFVIIAAFWRGHDRLFEHVERQDPVLLWLNVAWMFTIVWLPVATAMVGAMETDPAQLAIYIGTLLASSLISLAMVAWLRRRPELLAPETPAKLIRTAPTVIACGLFALALLLAVAVPGVQYWAMLVLLLNPLLDRLLPGRR
nr:TMEM175 family protein [Propionicimonas sp.]